MRILAPFPASCYTCSSIAYCSPKCRDHDKLIHDVECKILGPLWCSRASITCILAVRAVIKKPFKEFIKTYNEIKNNSNGFQISKDQPYLNKDYKAFYNLGMLKIPLLMRNIFLIFMTTVSNAKTLSFSY
jgi:hypothetical protein